MKALSIREPWAMLITMGMPLIGLTQPDEKGTQRPDFDNAKVAFKNIENRIWPLPDHMKGQRIYVHTGVRMDNSALEKLLGMGFQVIIVLAFFSLNTNRVPRGAIIGEVDLIDCITESNNPWFEGPYGFVLANPLHYKQPIPYKGRQGFFDVTL